MLAVDLSPRHEARPLLSSPAPKLRKPALALALSGATLLASLVFSGRAGVTGAEVELATGTPDGYVLEADAELLGTVVEAGVAAQAEVEAGVAARAEASVLVEVQLAGGPEPSTPRPSAGRVTIAQPRPLSARAATMGTVTSSPPRAQATATTATTAKKAPAATSTVPARVPVTTTRPPATSAAPAPSSSSDAVWDRLAQCESGNTNDPGAPYYGYWQFDEPTWRGMGQVGLPNDHSRAQQLVVAKRLQAMSGWSPWPGCARALGLL